MVQMQSFDIVLSATFIFSSVKMLFCMWHVQIGRPGSSPGPFYEATSICATWAVLRRTVAAMRTELAVVAQEVAQISKRASGQQRQPALTSM